MADSQGDSNIQRLQEAGYAIKTSLPPDYEAVIAELGVDDIDLLVRTSDVRTRIQGALDEAAQARSEGVAHYSAYMVIPPL